MAEKAELKEKQIRIIWGSDEDIPTLYANNLVISHAGGSEFHLTFGHLIPPLTIGLEEIELPDFVHIKPVARIVVGTEAMKKFVEVINDNYQKYLETQEGK